MEDSQRAGEEKKVSAKLKTFEAKCKATFVFNDYSIEYSMTIFASLLGRSDPVQELVRPVHPLPLKTRWPLQPQARPPEAAKRHRPQRKGGWRGRGGLWAAARHRAGAGEAPSKAVHGDMQTGTNIFLKSSADV